MTDAGDDRVGFEIDGEYVPIAFNPNHGKDLMLLDRIAALPVEEFMEAVDGGSNRAPIMLAMLATSVRAAHPDWSVDRIYKLVTDDLSDLLFIGGQEKEAGGSPPAEGSSVTPPPNEPAESKSEGSSASSTLKETSETLYAIPA